MCEDSLEITPAGAEANPHMSNLTVSILCGTITAVLIPCNRKEGSTTGMFSEPT
jgi:hypothetical protein